MHYSKPTLQAKNLEQFFANAPKLTKEELDDFERDLNETQKNLKPQRNKWN